MIDEIDHWQVCADSGKVVMILVSQHQVDSCKLNPGEYITPIRKKTLTALEQKLLSALKSCALVLAGEKMSKGALIGALEEARKAMKEAGCAE